MTITFRSKDLQDLYETGHSRNKFYDRLPLSTKKGFVKAYKMLNDANRIEDLFRHNSLHYEKLNGRAEESVRCDRTYRLLFESFANSNNVIITNVELINIEKHYGDN